MSLAKSFRRLGIVIIWLTSVYVVLVLLVALTEQGRPTSAVFATNLGELFYPEWYANPLVITAVKIAVLTYPAAALAYGIAALLSLAGADKAAPAANRVGNPKTPVPLVPLSRLAAPFAPTSAWSDFDDAPPLPVVATRAADHPENPENLCILDMAFFIRTISRNAAAMLGLPAHMLQRRPFTNFIVSADVSQLHAAWDRLLTDPQAVIALHLRIRRPDDVMVEADAICRAGLGADGRIISMTLLPSSEKGSLDDQLAAVWY